MKYILLLLLFITLGFGQEVVMNKVNTSDTTWQASVQKICLDGKVYFVTYQGAMTPKLQYTINKNGNTVISHVSCR